MYDFIMVGAGITGLELSALLAHDGHSVLVLEATDKIGGRAQLWKKDGWTVDYGIHLIRFGPKSAISKICNHLGHRVEYIPLGRSYVKDQDGTVKLFPTGPIGFLRSEMFTFMERLRALSLMLKIKSSAFDSLKTKPLDRWMDENGITGGMRRYLTLVSASMMVCPFIERSSVGEMLTNVGKVLRAGYSVMYPKGGWGPLYDLYLNKINKNGKIQLKSKVDSIIIESGRAKGVRTGSEIIEAGNVITCVPVQHLFSGILEGKHFQIGTVDGCNKQRQTAGVVLDYGLKKRLSETSGLWYLWKPMSFGLFTSNLEPSIAPAGRQSLTWFYPTEVEEMLDSRRAKERETELETAISELFPDLKRNIEWRRAMHLRMVDGVEVNINQYRERRFGPTLKGVSNLFLVGDSTRAEGAGGDIGHESVLECYRAITGREV